FVLFILGIAHLEARILSQLDQISKALTNENPEKSELFRPISRFTPESRLQQVRDREVVRIYEIYFRLHIFSLCELNWTFACSFVLFCLNYIVLVMQTSIQ